VTVTLPPWEAWAIAALAVLGASTLAGLAIGAVLAIRQRRTGGRPAPGAGNTPVPGTTVPPEAACPPSRPFLFKGPAITEKELRHLARIDDWTENGCDPVRRQSAGILADCFRTQFPHLSDDDLGRLLLNVSFAAREYGLEGALGRFPGTLALAAGELTRLARTEEVHFDQH